MSYNDFKYTDAIFMNQIVYVFCDFNEICIT